ncbi:MAG: biotin/lipoyl-containing protein, partial [Pirellulales bacterium]
MATEFKVPDLGENVDEGDIVSVMVKEGDEIQAEQNVMEIETGKAVVELPCPIAGRITKVHVQKGSKVKVGDPLLTVEGAPSKAGDKVQSSKAKDDGKKKKSQPKAESEKESRQAEADEIAVDDAAAEEQDAAAAEQKKPAKKGSDGLEKKVGAKARPAAHVGAASSVVEAAPTGKTPPAGPATRRLARELGADPAAIKGSGPHGRITEDDV